MKTITQTTNDPQDQWFENYTFDEIDIGDSAEICRSLTLKDIEAFAAVSGDTNPAHLDVKYANASMFHGIIGHGMWGGSLISTILGTVFPGPGTIYLEQSLRFHKPVRVGDALTVRVVCTEKNIEKKSIVLECTLTNQKNEKVLSGFAKVLTPANKQKIPRIKASEINLFDPNARFNNLISLGAGLDPVRCGVVHPCDEESLTGAVKAQQLGLIDPVLIGPEKKILALANQLELDLSGSSIVNAPHSHAAAELAAHMAAQGELEALMKGSLHTDELIHAVLQQQELKTEHRMSHVFRFETMLYPKPIYITDAALNISPSVLEKADIIQNAIDFARIMGVEEPKVAILSAVETVTPTIPSTVDAAALCKMAQRGQIKHGILDGPLAFDNAISTHAAEIKHIHSEVAGQADILVAPDLEAANMMAKQLEYLAGAVGCGIVLGAKIPIALTSRADTSDTRAASALLVKLIAHHNKQNKLMRGQVL